MVNQSDYSMTDDEREKLEDLEDQLLPKINAAEAAYHAAERRYEARDEAPNARSRLIEGTTAAALMVQFDGYRQGLITALETLSGHPYRHRKVLYTEVDLDATTI